LCKYALSFWLPSQLLSHFAQPRPSRSQSLRQSAFRFSGLPRAFQWGSSIVGSVSWPEFGRQVVTAKQERSTLQIPLEIQRFDVVFNRHYRQ